MPWLLGECNWLHIDDTDLSRVRPKIVRNSAYAQIPDDEGVEDNNETPKSKVRFAAKRKDEGRLNANANGNGKSKGKDRGKGRAATRADSTDEDDDDTSQVSSLVAVDFGAKPKSAEEYGTGWYRWMS